VFDQSSGQISMASPGLPRLQCAAPGTRGCRARHPRGCRSRGEQQDWDAWPHGTAAQADALIKLPPLGALRSGAEKPEEEGLLPAEQLLALKAGE
jgi:hypothetical protein